MKRADWIRLLVLVLAMSAWLATSAWAKTQKATSKTDADAMKKKTGVDTTKAGKDNDKDKDRPGKNKDKDEADAEEEVEILPDLTEFYAEVAGVVRLNEEGQKKLLTIQNKKKEALDKFDAKNDKMIVRIENEMDRTENEKRREKLRTRLKEIERNREKLQEQADNVALRVLSPDQRVAWNSYELWEVISPELEFEKDELALTDEQVEKAKGICRLTAQKMGAKGRIAKNPTVQKTAFGQIGRQVLTQKQREAYTLQQRRKRLHEETGEKKKIIRRGH
jgi:hypothetical protein